MPAERVGSQVGTATGSTGACFHHLIIFLAILVPDLIMVFVYSAVLLGPDVYDNLATHDRASMFGNAMVGLSGLWLMLLFVFDIADFTVRGSGGAWAIFQAVGLLVLVGLVFVAFTLKAVSYPMVPLFLCMCTPVLFLAIKRNQWKENQALPHFYFDAAVYYSIGAAVVLLMWIGWVLSAKSWHLWWNQDTKDWLAELYSRVYSQAYDGFLDHPLYWYCSDDDNLQGVEDMSVKDKISSACAKASTVCFVQWAGPAMVSICNILAAGFCILFSTTIANIQQERECRKRALLVFIKRFLLNIILAVAIMYTSLYVSGAAVKLGSAMLGLAAASIFIMFLWMCGEVDTQTLNDLKQDVPGLHHIIAVLQSNWVKALAVGGLNIMIPLLLLLDRARQRVRICTGVYKSNPSMDPDKTTELELYTPQGKRVFASLEKWDWTDIFSKVCVLGEVGVLMVLGSKATFIFFSYLNGVIGQSGMDIVAVTLMVGAIGLAMFLNPIVPGSAVYLFAGVVVGAQSQKESSVGIWAGLVLASFAGSVAKLCACVGQYFIGFRASKSVRVQQFVGVTRVATLAMESVLKEPGFRLFKVCILVAGPDFPTSVLCGILKLHIPQVLLGTCPVILVSVIPQTLVGVLLTKQGGSEGLWSTISTIATGLAAIFQAGATLIFSYGIMQTVEEKGEDLKQEAKRRPEFAEVRKLDEKEAKYVETLKEVSQWGSLGVSPRGALLGAATLFLLSGFMMAVDMMATEKICFRKFSITDDIGASYDRGGLKNNVFNVVHGPGWVAIGLAAVALVLHVGFGKWLVRTARHTYKFRASEPELVDGADDAALGKGADDAALGKDVTLHFDPKLDAPSAAVGSTHGGHVVVESDGKVGRASQLEDETDDDASLGSDMGLHVEGVHVDASNDAAAGATCCGMAQFMQLQSCGEPLEVFVHRMQAMAGGVDATGRAHRRSAPPLPHPPLAARRQCSL